MNSNLDYFFNPKSVAVIGVSRKPNKVGYVVFRNIIQYGFQGKVFPVNPKADEILGYKCFPDIIHIKEDIDLAVIVIPAKFVPSTIDECGKKGVKGVIVISAGFKETGYEGSQLEKEIVKIANRYNIRILGPNCLGIINTVSGLNASFAAGMPNKGSLALASQSGALLTSILDWALSEEIGFSEFVSLGNKADLNEIDFLRAWKDDPDSKVILLYLEGVRDGQEFINISREVGKVKPLIVIKSGGTSAGARAASSHTGTLAGADVAYGAAFHQAGIIRAQSIEEWFDFAVALASQPLPQGPRIGIITNAGGPGTMATDAIEKAGLRLATLNKNTVDLLIENLPPAANFYNPVDVLGDAQSDTYRISIEALLEDSNVDGVVAILAPQAMTDIVNISKAVGEASRKYNKPILCSFMGGREMKAGIDSLKKYSVPNYSSPERAISAFKVMVKYKQWKEMPYQTIKKIRGDKRKVAEIISRARKESRVNLGEIEAKEIISAYGFTIPQSKLAKAKEEAVEFASSFNFPVVLKIASPDIVHKSDIGGVKVGITNEEELVKEFEDIIYRTKRLMPDALIFGINIQEMATGKEVIIGMKRDPQFGPLLMFGLGGIYVEILKDVSFRIAPIGEQDAKEMIEEIRAYPILSGVRGEKGVDIDSLINVLIALSSLSVDFPEIIELDVNPLMVKEKGMGAVAIDARLTIN
ncbi:MAG: Succinate--CoA ligase (ADP-forming) subunit alpha [candidate division WS2 bacterium]|nr:Succinate--CoA ligase (ADP-forming) subunit alpha [Candidatus Psychracetigena formicireducens]